MKVHVVRSQGRGSANAVGRFRFVQRAGLVTGLQKDYMKSRNKVSHLKNRTRYFKSVSTPITDFSTIGMLTVPGRLIASDSQNFQSRKNAMQSGRAKTKDWQLDYEPAQPRVIEPLMGWTSSGDMNQQLTIRFETKQEAIAYCEREGIAYQLLEPKETAKRQVAYADNFAFKRVEPWTH